MSSALVVGDIVDNLKAELTLQKNFQSAAWAIKAASAASFFNRTSLLWLQQIQERISPQDARLQQNFNKLLAATQFLADTTVRVVTFAFRALSSSVATRRLVWLHNWQADTKSKWRLTAAPYSGGSLFGESLEPILIENKDKKNTFHFCHQAFGAAAGALLLQIGGSISEVLSAPLG